MKINLLSIFLLFVLWGCYSSRSFVEYEVLRPAKYSVPPELKSVILLKNCPSFTDKDAHMAVVNGVSVQLDSMINTGFADSVLVSLEYTMHFEHFFDTVYYDTLQYFSGENKKSLEQLSPQKVFEICDRYGADAVLGLEAYNYGTRLVADDYPDGAQSNMEVYGVTFWRMYNGYSGDVIFEELQKDTIIYYGYGATVNESAATLPSLKQANIEFSYYVGEQFAEKIIPKWELVQRQLFVEGNTYFVSAADWINQNNTEEALKLWGYLYEHGKKVVKARAAHNVAVTLEREGDIQNAVEWAYHSYDTYQGVKNFIYKDEVKDSRLYYMYLSNRIREIQKLKEQVGE